MLEAAVSHLEDARDKDSKKSPRLYKELIRYYHQRLASLHSSEANRKDIADRDCFLQLFLEALHVERKTATIIHHTLGVTQGATRALVVADMPFLSYQVSTKRAIRNAARIFQEGCAAAIKLEGGRSVAATVQRLTAGLPVMGHVGLTPQHVHRLGGMRQQARDDKAVQELLLDALALEDAGAFALVLEAIPDAVAEVVTSRLHIPTIGIGAGPHCDGQVLVSYDILGMFDTFVPPFVKQYAQLGEAIITAAKDYADDVRQRTYPSPAALNPIRAVRDLPIQQNKLATSLR